MNVTGALERLSDHRKTVRNICSHFSDNKIFSRIIKNKAGTVSHLISYPVHESSKTLHIDIHNAPVRVLKDHLFLSLQRRLIRNYQNKLSVRICCCKFSQIILYP